MYTPIRAEGEYSTGSGSKSRVSAIAIMIPVAIQMNVMIAPVERAEKKPPIRMTTTYPITTGAEIPPAVMAFIVTTSQKRTVNKTPAVKSFLRLTRVIISKQTGMATPAIPTVRPTKAGAKKGTVAINIRLNKISQTDV